MKTWISLIGPFIVWGGHFAGVYVAAEFAPEALSALAPILTILGLLANAYLIYRVDGEKPWAAKIAKGGAFISSIAIIWQALPVYI